MEIASKIQNGGVEYIEIDETEIELSSENLLITMHGKQGFAFAGSGETGVVLDTNLTEELKEEGMLREILSKVQNMRKDRNFEVMDKINLYISGNETVEKIAKKFEHIIKHDTLSENIIYNEPSDNFEELSINGEKTFFDVKITN